MIMIVTNGSDEISAPSLSLLLATSDTRTITSAVTAYFATIGIISTSPLSIERRGCADWRTVRGSPVRTTLWLGCHFISFSVRNTCAMVASVSNATAILNTLAETLLPESQVRNCCRCLSFVSGDLPYRRGRNHARNAQNRAPVRIT